MPGCFHRAKGLEREAGAILAPACSRPQGEFTQGSCWAGMVSTPWLGPRKVEGTALVGVKAMLMVLCRLQWLQAQLGPPLDGASQGGEPGGGVSLGPLEEAQLRKGVPMPNCGPVGA